MAWQDDLWELLTTTDPNPADDIMNSGAVQAVAGPLNTSADWLAETVQPPIQVSVPLAQVSRAWRKRDPRLLGEPIDWKQEMTEIGMMRP